jgi:hypothetical protein
VRARDQYDKLKTARRFFALIPLLTFLAMLVILSLGSQSAAGFGQVVLRALVVALATALVSIGGYGFYRYLQERSPGL